jgi:hypothetical protein
MALFYTVSRDVNSAEGMLTSSLSESKRYDTPTRLQWSSTYSLPSENTPRRRTFCYRIIEPHKIQKGLLPKPFLHSYNGPILSNCKKDTSRKLQHAIVLSIHSNTVAKNPEQYCSFYSEGRSINLETNDFTSK